MSIDYTVPILPSLQMTVSKICTYKVYNSSLMGADGLLSINQLISSVVERKKLSVRYFLTGEKIGWSDFKGSIWQVNSGSIQKIEL